MLQQKQKCPIPIINPTVQSSGTPIMEDIFLNSLFLYKNKTTTKMKLMVDSKLIERKILQIDFYSEFFYVC